METERRRKLNAERLALLHSRIRPNMTAIIADLEAAGWHPIVDGGVYRTPEEQAQKVAQKVSTVSYSYHNVTEPGNVPASMAADIVDVRYLWKVTPKYWLHLAAAAENQGMETGIYWGLSIAARNRIRAAIADGNWDAVLQLGWDTAHVQPPQSKFTISQAKAGWRYDPGRIKPNILPPLVQVARATEYKLLGGDGRVMDVLAAEGGTAYVEARKWGAWFSLQVDWEPVERTVLFRGQPVETLVRDGKGYVPIRAAAGLVGLSLDVDDAHRTIALERDR